MSEDEDYLASIGGAGATGTQEPSPESPRQETVTKEQVGRYERQAELGRGGIGRVWLGYDTHIGREVAIKELLDSASASLSEQSGGSSIYTARFLREARVTGRLEHPAIIPVYELGERDDGSLYYTMKYVRGRTLADSLAECHDLESRLSLLQHVANLSNAIAFAHGHRVLHRDIKPANVMVGSYGETVVLDWGLAKVLDDDPELTRGERRLKSPTEAAATLDGHALGTPAYMSPEQAEGRIEDVDQRSDVWGLGAVLYELLAGVPPYDGKTPYEIVGKVITADPSPIIEHEPAAPRELVAVAEKALSRKPNDRYDDASAFAAELESFRSGRRVEAHRYSTVELLQRVWNRHRSAVLVAAVALLAAVVLATVSYRRVSSERDRALEAESVARVRLGRALYEKAQVALERRDWLAAEALTAASLSYDDTPTARGLLLAPDRRWEPNLVWIRSFGWECSRVRLSPNGDSVACPSLAGVALLSRADGEETHRFVGGTGYVVDVVWSADGKTLSGLSSDGTVFVWSLGERRPIFEIRAYNSRASAVAGDTQSGALLTGGVDHSVSLWAWGPNSLRELWRRDAHGDSVSAVAVRGDRIASADESGVVILWDRNGDVLQSFRPHRDRIVDIEFRGDSVITASHDKRVVLTSLSGARSRELGPHDGGVASMGLSPGRELIATGDERGTVRFWDSRGGRPRARFTAHQAAVTGIDVAQETVVTASGDGVVRLWRLAEDVAPGRLLGSDDGLISVDWSSDGGFLAGGGRSGRIRLWSRQVPRPIRTWQMTTGTVDAVALSANGQRLAAVDNRGRLWLFSLEQTGPGLTANAGTRLHAVEFLPEMSRVVVGGGRRRVEIYDPELGFLRDLTEHRAAVNSVSVAPGGMRIASADQSGELLVWRKGESGLRLDSAFDAANALVFVDERVLASGHRDGRIVLWDTRNGSRVDAWRGHDDSVQAVAAHGESGLLATSARDHLVQIWRLPERRLVAAIDTSDAVLAMAFSPDGSELAGVNDDDEVLVWSVDRALEPVESLREQVRIKFGLDVDGVDVVPLSEVVE